MARRSSATELSHYQRYPICGYCMTVWDMIYCRKRSTTPPARWLDWCKVGGCDPDVWDHIDESTGWPVGWKVAKDTGLPVWAKIPGPPEFDDSVFHKRSTSDKNAQWRKVADRLRRLAIEQSGRKRAGVPDQEIIWEDDDDEEIEEVDLDDPDLWD